MHVLLWWNFSSDVWCMCYLSVFVDPKSLCLQQASTSAGRFAEGKQLHLTFCFLHQISDNISSLLVTGKSAALAGTILFLSVMYPQAFPPVFPRELLDPVRIIPEGQPGGASPQPLPLRSGVSLQQAHLGGDENKITAGPWLGSTPASAAPVLTALET